MRFFFDHAWLPKQPELLRSINMAAQRLFDKLVELDIHDLDISEYNKRYLHEHLENLVKNLQEGTYLLSWALERTSSGFDDLVFLEHGGGVGLVCLLVRELGLGTVVYHDIYDVSCRDARVIARRLRGEADHYVCGDIDDLLAFLKREGINCDVLVSHNVIEHIYDIDGFLRKTPLGSHKLPLVEPRSTQHRTKPLRD